MSKCSEPTQILFSQLGVLNIGKSLGEIWPFAFGLRMCDTPWDVGYAVDTLETAVDWNRLPEAVERIEQALREAVPDLPVHVFTHMSHIYAQGASIYTSYIFANAQTYEETLDHWTQLKAAASQAVVDSGGTISHQHGVGRDHAPYLCAEKGPLGMDTLGSLTQHFDPDAVLNPGVLLPESE